MILNARAENGCESSGSRNDVLVFLERLVTLERRHVERARQVVHDRVEHELHALVLEGRAAEHRYARAVERHRADRLVQLVGGGLVLVHELLHQRLVVLGELLEQLVTRGLGRGQVLLGDLGVLPLLAHVALPVVGVHLDEVDHAVEVALRAPGQLQHERVRGEPVDHHVDRCAGSRRRCGPSCSRRRCAAPRSGRPAARPSRTAARPRRPRRRRRPPRRARAGCARPRP